MKTKEQFEIFFIIFSLEETQLSSSPKNSMQIVFNSVIEALKCTSMAINSTDIFYVNIFQNSLL